MSPTVVRPLLLLAALLATLAGPSVAQAATPAPTALPTLSGTTRAGQTLTTTDGTWSGGGTMSYTRRWQRCDNAGANCTLIPGASAKTYVLQDADAGGTVRSLITAQNVDGTGPATASAPSDPIAPRQIPVNSPGDVMTVTGTPRDLQTLTIVPGTWTGTAPIAYTYRWYRCSGGGSCTVISGKTVAQYVVQSADVGFTIRGEVTATNPDGSAVASADTATVTGAAPANTTPPPLSGTAREGQTLTSNANGTWTGTPNVSFTRAWDRCDTAGAACVTIPGQTATTYRLTGADVGSTIRARVTGTNGVGSSSAQSAASAVVAPLAPPSSSGAPLITGQVVDGQTLTVGTGTWSGVTPMTYAYQWRRCDGLGTCTPITGATKQTYALTSGDVGYTIDAIVTATNADGSDSEPAPPTVQVAPAPPVATAAPVVTGSAKEGVLLTSSTGTWKGTPDITYAYQWQSCVSGTCANIAGATGASYRLTGDEVGENVRVLVTATNGGGSVAQPSATTAAVTAAPPTNVDLPSVAGPLMRDGQIVNANRGTWAGTATIVYNHQWMRCTAAGASCVAISGEVGPTYRLRSADVGSTVRLRVFAANGQGTVTADSPATPVIAFAPPSADAGTPTVTGSPIDGTTLTAGGTWSGTPPIALTYLWERCDALSSVCTTIPGATAATYTLTSADIGALVRVTVGASNAGGGDQATSTAVGPIVHAAPQRTGTPTLSGPAKEAADLTVSTTTFSGSPTMTYTATWERCDTAGNGCAPIPGATGLTRTLEAADRGHTVRAIVTAHNPSGDATATSELSAVVAASAPTNRVVPAITPGTGLKDGVLLTVSDGGWIGSGPMTYTYAWQRCDTTGTSCVTITGAVGKDYRLTSTDVGYAVRATVTATNMAGHTAQTSLVTSVVGTNPPVNTTPPSITGTARDGYELRAAAGDWDGVVPFTTTYQWLRCDASGDDCGEIPGATAVTYTLTPDDVGLTVRAQVLQSSAGGATAAVSAPSAIVLASPPVNLVRPSVDGKPGVGRVVTARVGSWVGTPDLIYTYQWHRCDADGSNCAPIPGATTSSYLLLAADNDRAVKVRVTATNAMSSDTAESDTTAQISDDPPLMIVAPEITAAGLVADGQVLNVTDGVWNGAQPITYTYAWKRCDATGTGCVPIAGATGSSYTLGAADVGRRIVAHVQAENAVAGGVADTAPSPVVLPEPPSMLTKPIVSTVVGMRDGAVLSGTTGTWKGATPIAYTYAWLRCDANGDDCQEIPDERAATYTLRSEDVGRRIVFRVSAKNGAAEVPATSDPTPVIAPALPVATVRPEVVVLDGKPGVGGRVKATTGTWTGTAPMSLDLQWQRCPATSLSVCDDIVGQTSAEYVLTNADVGRRVRVIVKATNAAGVVNADSAPTAMVPAVAPESLTPPVVTVDGGGVAREGAKLSASNGTWGGTGPIVFGLQWERCEDAGGAVCKAITGAVSSPYTLAAADVGKWIRAVVTGTNDGGKAVRASLTTAQVAAVAPVNVDKPTATMKATVKKGTTVASTVGKWTGTEKLVYTQRWQRCDGAGASCVDIPGADKATYVLTDDDLASETTLKGAIRVVVTAENAAGRAEAASAVAVAVAGTPTPAKPGTNTSTGTKTGGTSTGTKTGASGTKTGTGTSTKTSTTGKKTTTSGTKKTSGATSAAAKKKAAAEAAAKKKKAAAAARARRQRAKSVATLRSARLTADGKLVLTLQCAKKSKAVCGVRGSYKGGAVRGGLSIAKIARGKSAKKTIKLTAKQLKALKGKKKLTVTLRLAAPATPTRPKVLKRTLKIPTALRKGTAAEKKPATATTPTTPGTTTPTTGTTTTPSTGTTTSATKTGTSTTPAAKTAGS